MRKYIALFLALACILALCSCGWNSQKVVATVISESVTQIDITHRIGGKTTNWSVAGAEIDLLRDWLDKLSYKHIEFKEGQSPGDSNGGEVYTFVFTGGGWSGFSYVINGENDCYIQSEGYWFSVANPTNPPVSEPTE